MKRIYLYIAVCISALMTSCAEENFEFVAQDVDMPICISSVYPVSGAQTRADANGFVAGDEVGIFIVDYKSDGSAANLEMNGVRASNALFTYNGSTWDAPYQIYWANKTTPADFYGYYPYDAAMETPQAHPFSVSPLQDSDGNNTTGGAGYEASDILWAKTEKVQPTTQAISLQYKHLMAGITISLEKGDDFTDGEWNGLTKTVLIGNTELSGTINLQEGSVSVGEGNVKKITPLSYNGTWRAVVIPQVVPAGESLVIIDVAGQTYRFVKDEAMTYYSGRMHNFTITVNKKDPEGTLEFKPTSGLISNWVDDPDFHDGVVREYISVHIENPGTLAAKLAEEGYVYDEIGALKITGVLNHDDLNFIGEQLIGMTALNIKDITITGNDDQKDCLVGIGGRLYSGNKGILAHIILPASLKKIGDSALRNVGLVGNIDIPDGVEYIGREAFRENNLTGELKLPSSLKYLGPDSFSQNEGLSGMLRLPEGLEVIESNSDRGVFGSTGMTGPLILPSSLVKYGRLGFAGTMGKIVTPPKTTVVPEYAFVNSGCTQVQFHDGINEIHVASFRGSSLSGELVLPPNLKYIAGGAFNGTKISKIIFPESLILMGEDNTEMRRMGVFGNCVYLTGIVELPKNIGRIPRGCFYNCSNITGLVIPEGVELIAEEAFSGCTSISSIVCKGEIPPVVSEKAFYGINKDNFTIEVPVGCIEAYRQAPGWKEFKRFAEYSGFVCRPSHVNALNNPHEETLILNADSNWKVTECPDWVILSSTSGTNKAELTLRFKELDRSAGNRTGTIKFVMPDTGHTTSCEVSQYDYEYEEDGCLTLQKHSKGNGGPNIIFVGDGFDGQAISDMSYLNLVSQQMEYFFAVEPYKSRREYFDVHVTFPLSQECGVNTMNTYVNNRFGTLYGYDGSICTSNQLITSVDEVINYAVDKSPIVKSDLKESLIILVPNDDAYDGYTIYSGDATISICPPSSRPYPQDTRGVIQHEAGGHGYGKLADESVVYSNWVPTSVKTMIEDYQAKGWYQNISLSSKFNSVPWAQFIFDSRYSDHVDIYEGGCEYMRGVFRPESNSCMNYGIPYYNVISRYDIVKRIMLDATGRFESSDFFNNDSFEWGDIDAETRSGNANEYFTGSAYAESNSHIPPMMIEGGEMDEAVRSIRDNLKRKTEE